jgi:flavin reductase (DIM6/NTAB) family NADH-FMN oxidoreductase RutF
VSSDPFDRLVTGMDTAMVIVTANHGEERSGCLVGFHTQCSIDPKRYAVWISKANHTHGVAVRAEHLALHVLTSADHALAERFGGQTGDEVDKFAGVEWEPGPGGVPLLTDCPNRVVTRRLALVDEPPDCDHVCVIVEPVEVVAASSFAPLRFDDVRDIEPGHDA